MGALLPIFLLCVFASLRASAASEVSFRNDVMAALAKSSCNMGTCHGNATGKGANGFPHAPTPYALNPSFSRT